MLRHLMCAVAVGCVAWSCACSAAPAQGGRSAATRAAATAPAPEGLRARDGESLSVTEHQLAIGSETLRYRAVAGTIPLKDEAGKVKANIFFTAYDKLAADPARRPVMFVFNGGPGAASVWLHLGAVGPLRIDLSEEGVPGAPPYRLVENPHTWLVQSDLVFIDPVGTGYSRPAAGEKAEQFYGPEEDVHWTGDFIRIYLTRFGRWASPKFLAGESYGTTRAAGLSEYLLDRYAIPLNGIVLVSSVLNFQTISFGAGNTLPYALYLPSYTAAAFYHKKLAGPLQEDLAKALKEAEQFALGDYTLALTRGAALPEADRKAAAEKLARLTGLPVELALKHNLRIALPVFQKHLLAGERLLVGRFDARITGHESHPDWSHPAYDPSLSRYFGVYGQTFNDYARRALKYESDLPYEVLSDRVRPWNFGRQGGGYLFVADTLRIAMVKNPHLKVMFASGYFDLATPYLATDYTINQMELSRDLRGNIRHKYYLGGHMMYHYRPALEAIGRDVGEFVLAATPARP